MARYERPQPTHPKGWSDWLFPEMELYKLACCDCGLVHDFEFAIAKLGPRNRAGQITTTLKDLKRTRVAYRVRRNNRATAAMRRGKDHKKRKHGAWNE